MNKTIGKHKKMAPIDCLRELEAINIEMNKLRPYRKPRGLILKFKTYEELYDFTITRAAKKI